jgi:cell division protein FtsB
MDEQGYELKIKNLEEEIRELNKEINALQHSKSTETLKWDEAQKQIIKYHKENVTLKAENEHLISEVYELRDTIEKTRDGRDNQPIKYKEENKRLWAILKNLIELMGLQND